jgi:phage terminase small subunit
MSRPRKPAKILEISGAYLDQPGRRRPPAPKSTEPIGDPPAELDEAARRCWREVVAEAAPGLLTEADRGVVELVAAIRARNRRGEATTSEVGVMLRGLVELGLTPARRSKVAPAGQGTPVDGATPWGFLRKN